LISIKKYLESDVAVSAPDGEYEGELVAATLQTYRNNLLEMGKSGYRACPASGANLQHNLSGLEKRLAREVTAPLLQETGKEVSEYLSRWGEQTAEHLRGKTEEVKDLLITLARTAESLGERDQHYAGQLHQLTSRLRNVANLEDLSQVRFSLMETANELRTCVDQMEQDGQQVIARLQTRVATYETKLKETEELALRDGLTGLPNRLHLERRMELRIESQQQFCVAFIDLNRFKTINDRFGHSAGDQLLKQFADELRANMRPGDLVGRWSGDEFLVLLDSNLAGAAVTIERIRKWVFGDYTISGQPKVRVDAAIGLAERLPGETIQQLIERVDRAMYDEKGLRSPEQNGLPIN
jgi:diguanylate cyclase (GGDEF)-like protein